MEAKTPDVAQKSGIDMLLLLLSICLTAEAAQLDPLGRSVYLPHYDLMGPLEETQSQILRPDRLKQCTYITPKYNSRNTFSYYKSTNSFYSSMTTTFGLDASLKGDFSMGFTLDSVSKGIAGSQRNVTGNSLLIMAMSREHMLKKECLYEQEHLDPTFLNDFTHLPGSVSSPWLVNSWKPYDIFLRKHGSHVISSYDTGSSINQMAFAESTNAYSERDFQVKSCIALGGTTDVGKLNVSTCTGIDKSEIERVSRLSMSDTLSVTGGHSNTRNELIRHRTAELIETFMNQANSTNATIKYTFTPVWEVLQGAFAGVHSEFLARAVHLEYYYLGYLNYGCDYQESGGQFLQRFVLSSGSTPSSPQYECQLGPQGCHSDDDCHYKPIWCSCRGSSCIRHIDVVLDTGVKKTVAYANTNSDWGWQGCGWKKGLAGSKCICYEPKIPTIVWSQNNKDAMYMAHNRSMSSSRSSRMPGEEIEVTEVKQEL